MDESRVLMSDLREQSGEDITDLSGEEKASLIARGVDKELANDSEVYSTKACLGAQSCKICLIVSVIATLFVLAGLILILVAGLTGRIDSPCEGIELGDVFNASFHSSTFSGKWTGGGQLIHLSSNVGLLMVDPASNHTYTIISPDKLAEIAGGGRVNDFKLSPDFSPPNNVNLLLILNRESVYRHTRLADYILYQNGQVFNVTKPQELNGVKIQYAEWSPTGQHIALVIDYDLYLYDPAQPGSEPTPLTQGGSRFGVHNAIPDWVYEEEILSSDNAMWWSPDGSAILYASFNDTLVNEYSYPQYGSPDHIYTHIESIPYPKPGTTNPTVSVHVVDISTEATTDIETFDHYLIYAGWVSSAPGGYYICWLNRASNRSQCCTYLTGECSVAFSEEHSDGWIELVGPESVIGNVSDGVPVFYTILPQPVEQDFYPRLVKASGDGLVFLTKPQASHVTKIEGVNENYILFVSTEKGPGTRHVYSLNTGQEQAVCVSCDQQDWDILESTNPSLPSRCDYFTIHCDPKIEHCLLNCAGPCIPFSLLVSYDQSKQAFQPVRFLERNKHLHEAVREKCLPTYETFTVPADSDNSWDLRGEMLKPPQFDQDKQHSVLVYVYGGPDSQTVDSKCMLSSLSHVYYVTQLNIILASVDGRGTGYRGQKFKFSVYRDLGNLDTADQLRAGEYLAKQPYVDGTHLAIYGSSYGGYMAGRAGSSGTGVYSTAISQAPVTDWRYYDSIYTERYMNEPRDNKEAYHNSSILVRANKLRDVHFLLIHGTGDDNVHFQHTAQLVEALTQADVQFRLQIYTDKTHSISGGNTQRHRYELIADFLREHLY